MRKYNKVLSDYLQNNTEIRQENSVSFEIKPIPDPEKTEGMDPRMLEAAKRKMKKLQSNFSAETFQLYEERNRTDKISYDLTSVSIMKKQQLVKINKHYINTFLYRPRHLEDKIPVILYVHGGAFMTGDHTQFENQCKLLAEKAEALVVFPEYRLAPENPFPAGLEDIFGVLNWIFEQSEKLQINQKKIVLAGDSAGASIMNGCALLDKNKRIRLMFEIYPCCDIDVIGNGVYQWKPSYYHIPVEEQEYVYSRMDRLKNISKGMTEFYLEGESGKNPLVSIIYEKDISLLPPVIIAVGEYDYFRMTADIFARQCSAAGKLRKAIRYQGCDHGFFDMLGIMPQAEDCIVEVAKAVREI